MSRMLAGLFLAFWAQLLFAGGDEDYLEVREAFRAGNAARVAEYVSRMKYHVLAPYAEYFQLRLSLDTADTGTVKTFLARYDGSFVADRLRADWLQLLGKRQQWALYLMQMALPFASGHLTLQKSSLSDLLMTGMNRNINARK